MVAGSPQPVENPPLSPDAPPRYENYYLHDSRTGEFNALLTSAPSEEPGEFRLELLGVTPDLAHSVFETDAALSPGAVRQPEGNLYEWASGRFAPINVPPGGSGETSPGGVRLGSGFDESHTISDDGSRVFWELPAPGSESLFVREGVGTGQAATVQIDKSQGGVDPGGSGEFMTASTDGSRAFFTDERRLTPDATAGENGRHQDLYMFDVNQNRLSDLTVDGADIGGAAVQGVLGASENGSYVYFVAVGGLPDTGAIAGDNNLYVWHEGVVKFLVALAARDEGNGANREPMVAHDWEKSTSIRTARVSADGRRLLFMSSASLTGYDNRDARSGVRDEEVFLYDAEANAVTCVSCNPSGVRPVGPSGFPGGTPWRTTPALGTYEPRVLSEGGTRVFFDSKDALVPQDTNGAQDVYEWEQGGTGSCREQAGCIFLLSGGTSVSDSSFVDASADGSDAFFITRAGLVPQDTDQLRDLYDAREGGGFPAPAAPAASCEGESCLPSASSSASLASLASTMLGGTGNIAPAFSSPVVKIKAKKKPAKKAKKRAGNRKKRKRKANTRRTRAAGAGVSR